MFSIYKYFYFSQKGIDKFIKLFEVKNVYLGLLIHESYIKEKKYFLDKNFLLPKFFFFKIFYSYILVIYFEKYINQLNINNIILSKSNSDINFFTTKKSFLDKPKRVWVHTCSLDHKNALKNYLSRGMKIFKTESISV